MRRVLAWGSAWWLLCAAMVRADDAERPWEQPPFAVSAKDIVAAIQSLPVDDELREQTLLDERQHSLDEQGRETHRVRRVVRVLSKDAVEANATLTALWAPWYQDRPEVTARVITPDGEEHRLRTQDIAEQPANQWSNSVLDDRRGLKAPMPAVKIGVVIESLVVTREHKSFFDKGTVRRNFWPTPDTLRAKLKIDAPRQLPLDVRVRGGTLEPRRSEQDGRVILEFETRADAGAKPKKFADEFEWFTPPDQPVWLEVQFGTGRTWQDIATAYSKIVEAKLENSDLKTVANQAIAGAASRAEKIQKLLGKLQELVRYTAVHFGDAAIVPYPPLETLRRRYGDCKDQATLLVGLLRAADIPAHVALLNAGGGPDIHAELPGLGTMNHAITFVPGDPPIWIDPTVMFLPAGRLPSADQGRWALVIDAGTKELTKTPRASSDDNFVKETYEFIYSTAQQGVARVTLENSGTAAAAARTYYAETSPKDLREAWERYSLAAFQSKSLRKLDHSDPRDMSTPCVLRVECVDSPIFNVLGPSFFAAIRLDGLIDDLPFVLRTAAEAAAPKPRRAPLWLPERFVREQHVRIQPPHGYVIKELPEKKSFAVAGATFSQQFATEASGAVVAQFRFDTGEGIVPPNQVAEFRKALRDAASPAELGNWTMFLTFEHLGVQHLAAGRMKEALALFDQLARQFPNEAMRQMQLAETLAIAGFGVLGREHARRAVELEPKLPKVHESLHIVLTRDLLGRQYAAGFDWRGARAAIEEAVRLEPANQMHRWNLAILLEHGQDGWRYGTDAPLADAADIYEKLSKTIKTDAADPFFATRGLVMGHLDQFAAIKSLLSKRPPSPERDVYLILSTAAVDGAEAAKLKARQLVPDPASRREYFLSAGDLLSRFRRYPEAVELFEAGLGGPKDQQIRPLINSIRTLRRTKDVPLAEDDPSRVVRALLESLLTGGDAERDAFRMFAGSPKSNRDVASIGQLQRAFANSRRSYRENGHSAQRLLDNVTLFAPSAKDQVADMHVLTTDVPLQGTQWFVVRDGDELRLLDTLGTPIALADRMLLALEQGRDADARKWFAWLKPRFPKSEGGFLSKLDPFSDSPFVRFTVAPQLDAEGLKVAAASVAVAGSAFEKSLAILEKAREASPELNHVQFDRAIASGLIQRERYADALKVIERLETKFAKKPEVAFFKASCLAKLEGSEKSLAYLEPFLAESLKETRLLVLAARLASSVGQFDRAIELARRARQDFNDGAAALGVIAAAHLFHDEVPVEAFTAAEQAANLDARANPESLFVLAAVQARTGKPREALETLGQAIDLRRTNPEPEANDWYVIGLVAEEYGLADFAKRAYAQVPAPADATLQNTPHALAQRRLEKLASATK